MASMVWQTLCRTTGNFMRTPLLHRSFATESAAAVATVEAPMPSPLEQATTVRGGIASLQETVVPRNDLVDQLVNTIMRDGKKARAQRLVSDTMKELQRKQNVEDPYGMLAEAIETAAPLLKLTTTKKGSKATHVPTPLRLRQRRRRAIVWMLEASAKRPEKSFEQRFAAEVYDVCQGTSTVLQKKAQIHKQALANRANAQVSYNNQA